MTGPLTPASRWLRPPALAAPGVSLPPPPPRRPGATFVRFVPRRVRRAARRWSCWAARSARPGGYVAWRHFSADLPDVDGLRNYQPPVMSRVFAGDGRLIAELATERRIFVPFTRHSRRRQAGVRLRRGPEFLDCIAASIRWRSPAPAVFDLTHMGQGRRPIGASTITQQVAKNMLLDNTGLARRARSARRSWRCGSSR